MSPLALSLQFLQAQPDSRLIELARGGHERAFEALVRRYRKELLGYCRRLQPSSGSAEDVLQQTLLQAWRALKAGAEVREARPWLYRIAHNVSLNHLRVAVAVPQQAPEAADWREVHRLVEQRLEARAALAGMASLPALQRDVFVSATLNGASHEEVASALGLTSGAVRGLIYRARATLRSAAAGVIPTPALHWAIRRAETPTGRAPALTEALTGGGGAGVAAAIAKGGAVLTLAGAVAGAGGVIIDHSSSRPPHPVARLARPSNRAQDTSPFAGAGPVAVEPAIGVALRDAARRSRSANHLGQAGRRGAGERGRGSGSAGEGPGGSAGERGSHSPGESDGGPSIGSSGRSDGGSLAGAATSRDGSSGTNSSGSSRGPGGGSGGATSGSTSTTSGSDGGMSGGAGPSSGGPLTIAQMTSDGGSTSSTPNSPDSSTTTTTGSH